MYVVLDEPFLVSMHPTVLIRGSNSSDDEEVKRIISELVPAATLNVEAAMKALKPGESLALYVTNSRSKISPSSLVPVPPGATEMPVPAGTPVVPLVMKGTEIEAVGERVTIDVGGRGDAVFRLRNTATVVVPFLLPDADEKLDRPLITVMHRRLAKPLARYTLADADYRGLIFVENVERGPLDIIVDGTAVTARPLRTIVDANMNGKVITTDDLVMPIADTWTTVAWTIDEQFAKDVRAATHCDGTQSEPAPASLKLYSCAAGRTVSRPSQLADCTLVRETALPKEISGNVRWLAPLHVDRAIDEALVELTYGGISSFEPVSFEGSKRPTLPIQLAPRFITGRITNRGEAVAAEVTCGGPIQATDVAGYYRCWRPPVNSAVILTNPCDGSGTYQQAFDDAATVVDVQIATNTLTVKVIDASTGEPLENAVVSLWEGSPNQVPEPDSTPLGPTDKSGEVSASRLEPRKVAVCAYKKEFERSCDEDVTVEHDAEAKVTLKMQRESLVRGKIASPAEIVSGQLFLMTGSVEIEDATVERDGTFALKSRPPVGTAFVLTSASLPLCVLRSVASTGTINLSVPSLRPQSFAVTSRGMRTPSHWSSAVYCCRRTRSLAINVCAMRSMSSHPVARWRWMPWMERSV
jgi:hypothetical protein